MAFVEDITPFFTDFGVPATVDGVAVTGIFDNAAADVLGFTGTQPVLLASSSAVTSAAVGDAVTVGGSSYTIAHIAPDGTGITRLTLEEA